MSPSWTGHRPALDQVTDLLFVGHDSFQVVATLPGTPFYSRPSTDTLHPTDSVLFAIRRHFQEFRT